MKKEWDRMGLAGQTYISLATLNDAGFTFEDIAKLLEAAQAIGEI